jgi:hypothetical protein
MLLMEEEEKAGRRGALTVGSQDTRRQSVGRRRRRVHIVEKWDIAKKRAGAKQKVVLSKEAKG